MRIPWFLLHPSCFELNLEKPFSSLAVLDVAGLQGERGRQMEAVVVTVIVMERRPTLSGSDWSVKKHDCSRFGSIAC